MGVAWFLKQRISSRVGYGKPSAPLTAPPSETTVVLESGKNGCSIRRITHDFLVLCRASRSNVIAHLLPHAACMDDDFIHLGLLAGVPGAFESREWK